MKLPHQISAKEFVKLTSSVPVDFIDELFEFYDEYTNQSDPVINLDVVAKWLSANKYKLVITLKKSYKYNFDYIITPNKQKNIKKDPRANNNKLYLLTPDCFKRLAMMSRSKNAEMVRTYFIEIENMYLKYREQTLEGMKNEIDRLQRNQKVIKNIKPKLGYIYVIRASEYNDSLVKIGRTKNLTSRLKTYNSGQADDIEVLYTYRVPDIVSAEGCVKSLLRQFKYRKYKEVYQADINMVKELLKTCGDISAKLHYKKQKMEMTGGFYIVIHEDTPSP